MWLEVIFLGIVSSLAYDFLKYVFSSPRDQIDVNLSKDLRFLPLNSTTVIVQNFQSSNCYQANFTQVSITLQTLREVKNIKVYTQGLKTIAEIEYSGIIKPNQYSNVPWSSIPNRMIIENREMSTLLPQGSRDNRYILSGREIKPKIEPIVRGLRNDASQVIDWKPGQSQNLFGTYSQGYKADNSLRSDPFPIIKPSSSQVTKPGNIFSQISLPQEKKSEQHNFGNLGFGPPTPINRLHISSKDKPTTRITFEESRPQQETQHLIKEYTEYAWINKLQSLRQKVSFYMEESLKIPQLLRDVHALKYLTQIRDIVLGGVGKIVHPKNAKPYDYAIALIWCGPLANPRLPEKNAPDFHYIYIGIRHQKLWVNGKTIPNNPITLQDTLFDAINNLGNR